MKRFITAAALLAAAAFSAFSQEKELKTGWTFGALPCATYSNDMGFQYGAFGDVYYYGDGNTYPDPLHKISWEASHYTKGRSRFYLAYDSKYVIPKMRVTCSATYVDDPLYSFYGYNGSASQIAEGMPLVDNYYMKRNMFRLLADFQGQIAPHLKWAGGINFWNFKLGDINGEKYSNYDPSKSMYNYYVQNGLIGENEADGGNRLEAKAGFVYDTRDIEAAPNKGMWAELYVNGSPDLFGDGYAYLKLCAHFRQYLTIPVGFIKAGDPVFAYHLGYQSTVAGEAPFYVQQNISALVLKSMISEGFGSYSTVRGTHTNRIIADGYAWGNFELRVKIVNFKLFNQYFYLAANPFLDCGLVTKGYRQDIQKTTALSQYLSGMYGYSNASDFIQDKTGEFIYTTGIGLKLAWNQNFIISAEVAHNFNTEAELGDPLWISIGTNYCF